MYQRWVWSADKHRGPEETQVSGVCDQRGPATLPLCAVLRPQPRRGLPHQWVWDEWWRATEHRGVWDNKRLSSLKSEFHNFAWHFKIAIWSFLRVSQDQQTGRLTLERLQQETHLPFSLQMVSKCPKAPTPSSSPTDSTVTHATSPIPKSSGRSVFCLRTRRDGPRMLTCPSPPDCVTVSVRAGQMRPGVFQARSGTLTLLSLCRSGQRFALMEEKVVLASILRKFNVEACQTREELRPMGELILRPEKGIWIKLGKKKPLISSG